MSVSASASALIQVDYILPLFLFLFLKAINSIPQNNATTRPLNVHLEFPKNVWAYGACPVDCLSSVLLNSNHDLLPNCFIHGDHRIVPSIHDVVVETLTHIVIYRITT